MTGARDIDDMVEKMLFRIPVSLAVLFEVFFRYFNESPDL